MPDEGRRSKSNEKPEKTPEERGVQDLRCYHGVMNKEEVKLVMKNVFVGFFLVRSCFVKNKVALVLMLSVRVSVGELDPCIHHYVIDMRGNEFVLIQELKDPDGTSIVIESKPFTAVDKMIEYYQRHRLACKVRLYQPINRPSWQVRHMQIKYDEHEKLGTGNTCVVFKGKLQRGKTHWKEVAIKMSKEEETKTSEALLETRNLLAAEARIMVHYNHPNVVKFYGLACERPPFMVCMEYCVGGSLEEALKKFGKEMEELERQTLLIDAARGMRYLHTQKCVHRDLAARNCLISADGQVKIADFGLSRTLKKRQRTIKEALKEAPLHSQAPESIQNLEFSPKTDIWSFGVLIYEIYNNSAKLFAGVDEATMLKKIKKARMPSIESQTKLVKMHELLAAIWMLNPEERPSFQKILEFLIEALVPMEADDFKKFQINKIKGVTRNQLPSMDVEMELASHEEVKRDESPSSREKLKTSTEKVRTSKEKDASTKREKKRKMSHGHQATVLGIVPSV